MKLSSDGLDFIARHETIGGQPNLTLCIDSKGHPTIGYGHLARRGEDFSNGITAERAKAILAQDVRQAEAQVNGRIKVNLTQPQFDALASVTFNSPRALKKLARLINTGKPVTSYDFVNTLPRKFSDQPGLIRRRREEARTYLINHIKAK
jgi:GH24 family phage-related lysozyme (muramidase)